MRGFITIAKLRNIRCVCFSVDLLTKDANITYIYYFYITMHNDKPEKQNLGNYNHCACSYFMYKCYKTRSVYKIIGSNCLTSSNLYFYYYKMKVSNGRMNSTVIVTITKRLRKRCVVIINITDIYSFYNFLAF